MTTAINDDNDTDASFAGLTLTAIYRKHKLLRGTDNLKYLGERRLRCQGSCSLGDMPTGEWGKRQVSDHPCFLAPSHNGPCEFSSECAGSRFREVSDAVV